jgi:ankyrin repeat protein
VFTFVELCCNTVVLHAPSTFTNNSGTLLHAAAEHGKAHFVQLLGSKGISVNAKNLSCGHAALHLACVHSKPAFAEALLDSGADINSVSRTGTTPALIAAIHGSAECLQLLAERGADLSIRDLLVTQYCMQLQHGGACSV